MSGANASPAGRSHQYVSLWFVANRVTSAAALFASIAVVCYAQVNTTAHASSASHVAAEMTKGRLSPADSKPGDTVAIRLNEDVRSNGEVIFKKGTVITGVVRSVRRAEGKGDWKSGPQSMIDIGWLVPALQHRGVQGVSFTLQSIIQVNNTSGHQQTNTSQDLNFPHTAVPNSSPAVNGRSNVALLSMPSVIAADQQTSASIETALGTETAEQLFKVGHGQLVSSGGSKESVELYSHLSNDTVITSPSNTFEISSGAQIQLLVGVNRR